MFVEMPAARIIKSKHDLPILFHTHDGDAVILSLVERLGQRAQSELTIVSRLPLRVVMVEEQRKPSARAGPRVTHHGEIAIGIAERQ